MGNTISDIYINLNNALNHCNKAFTERDIEPVNTISEIEDRLKLVSITDIINSTIEGTITELSNKKAKKVYDNVFAGCTSLTSVDLPVCTSIGVSAFQDCTSLTFVNLPICNYIESYAFLGCTSLTSVNLPMCSYISSGAFRNCTSLTSANLPICSYIGSYAFSDCASLTSIDLPMCRQINGYTFQDCTSLTSITLSICNYIGTYAFSGCTSLTSVVLGYKSVVSLGGSVFNYTPIHTSSYTGSFGSIYVPASLVDAYKATVNWSTYADRITAIVEVNNNE